MEENKKYCLGDYYKCFGITALVLAGILCLFLLVKVVKDIKTYSYIGEDSSRNTISVNGKGEVYVKPDIATVSFSVTEEGLDVSKASNDLNIKIADIVKNLKSNGIDEKDIKTTEYSIYPRYDYLRTDVYTYSSKQVLAAYVVTQGIQLKIRDLSKAGKILTDLGTLKVTNMSGLTFSSDNYDELVKQAREDAIKEAREEAKKLAKDLGVKLGEIVNYYDSGMGYPYYSDDISAKAVYGMGEAAVEANVPTGENKITSNVTITYEIK
jgi:uncharacterized protein YggE